MSSNGDAALGKEKRECCDAVMCIRRDEQELDSLYPINCPDPAFPRVVAKNARAQNRGIIALLNSRVAAIEVEEARARTSTHEKSAMKISVFQLALQNFVKLVVFVGTAWAAGKLFFK